MSNQARLEITVHIGQKIRVSAIFIFTYRVKTSIYFTLLMSPVYLPVFSTETISSDEGSIDILTPFSYFCLSRKCGNIHLT